MEQLFSNCKNLKVVRESPKFTNWFNSLDENLRSGLKSICIRDTFMFGPNVGFITLEAEIKKEFSNGETKQIPGYCFLRGGSVAILVVIECSEGYGDIKKGEKYTILTRQARVPIGKSNFPEIPAGMLDNNNNFAGVAAKEMHEETGIKINQNELINLTEMYQENGYKGAFPSAGGSDEFIVLYAYETLMSGKTILELQGKLTGEIEEGESITLQIIPFDQLISYTPDMKALSSLCLYNNLKSRSKLQKSQAITEQIIRPKFGKRKSKRRKSKRSKVKNF